MGTEAPQLLIAPTAQFFVIIGKGAKSYEKVAQKNYRKPENRVPFLIKVNTVGPSTSYLPLTKCRIFEQLARIFSRQLQKFLRTDNLNKFCFFFLTNVQKPLYNH